MKILFTTAHPYLPQLYGGLQTSTDEHCRQLKARGHEVCVLAGLTPSGVFGFTARLKMQINKLFGRPKVAHDRKIGYSTWRTWFPWEVINHVVKQERPDLIVVLAGEPARMALAAKSTHTPILMGLQNVEFQLHGDDFKMLGQIPCVANSNFTAEKYHRAYGVRPAVIYPFMSLDKYKTETTRENVTFINPFPEKGRDIALEIARQCPEIPFSFIEAWPLPNEQRAYLDRQLALLPNIKLVPPQKDMRNIYGKCKILLVPSIWEEAYGRVATEAQVSGIPVVASLRGGLPEAVGPGGILIDPEAPVENWVKAVKDLWQNDTYYAEKSKAATDYALRKELNLDFQIKAYEDAFQDAIRHQS